MTKQQMQLSLFENANVEHWESIRRVELNGEMHYSILDIFKFYGDTTNYRQEWSSAKRALKKQGFDSSIKNIQLHQFEGERQRPTPVANLEVFLRIAQVTSFKHWESIRRFMSGAAAEKLESMAGIRRQREIEKYERAGYGDAPEIKRLRARDENIKCYKELKSVMSRLIDSPNWAELTNAEYLALFGNTAKQLKALLGDDSIRDNISTTALHALTLCESMLRDALNANGAMDNRRAVDIITMIIKPIGDHLQTVSQALGVHHITGKPLLGSGE